MDSGQLGLRLDEPTPARIRFCMQGFSCVSPWPCPLNSDVSFFILPIERETHSLSKQGIHVGTGHAAGKSQGADVYGVMMVHRGKADVQNPDNPPYNSAL